jgi:hypothetical protein
MTSKSGFDKGHKLSLLEIFHSGGAITSGSDPLEQSSMIVEEDTFHSHDLFISIVTITPAPRP